MLSDELVSGEHRKTVIALEGSHPKLRFAKEGKPWDPVSRALADAFGVA